MEIWRYSLQLCTFAGKVKFSLSLSRLAFCKFIFCHHRGRLHDIAVEKWQLVDDDIKERMARMAATASWGMGQLSSASYITFGDVIIQFICFIALSSSDCCAECCAMTSHGIVVWWNPFRELNNCVNHVNCIIRANYL